MNRTKRSYYVLESANDGSDNDSLHDSLLIPPHKRRAAPIGVSTSQSTRLLTTISTTAAAVPNDWTMMLTEHLRCHCLYDRLADIRNLIRVTKSTREVPPGDCIANTPAVKPYVSAL